MATTALRGNPVHTVGELPAQGSKAPTYTLTGSDLSEVSSDSTQGKRVVLNIFPSVDTGVCAASVRKFNELAAGLDNTAVVNVSADLPFALSRFCGAEGIDNVIAASAFRDDFGQRFGVTMTDGAMRGLLARSVVVVDTDGTVLHSQLVPEITTEPDYDAAVAALG
ncbi:thiol peroxidase [Cumulibacter manganitolerans]|uniref:thiol peroxidase n=1 Tax=Cumulibacter manganitolerans TaxID=1884992 RepID=UPI00129631C6|nr:thiol peroxidase [Cumulibacter manganitolerans]